MGPRHVLGTSTGPELTSLTSRLTFFPPFPYSELKVSHITEKSSFQVYCWFLSCDFDVTILDISFSNSRQLTLCYVDNRSDGGIGFYVVFYFSLVDN